MFAHEAELRIGFHAFGNGTQAQAVSQGNNGLRYLIAKGGARAGEAMGVALDDSAEKPRADAAGELKHAQISQCVQGNYQ